MAKGEPFFDGLKVRVAIALMLLAVFSCKKEEDISANVSMLTFSIAGIEADSVSINQNTGEVTVVVPFGTVLENRLAEITLTPGASVVPAADIPQNFAKPILYVVSNANGSKKAYTVSVVVISRSKAIIEDYDRDSVRAGEELTVVGKNFGKEFGRVKAYLVKEKDEIPVAVAWAGPNKLLLSVPDSTPPGTFLVKIVTDGGSTIGNKPVHIKIHAPEISAVRTSNILQGDSLEIIGNFIVPADYKYKIVLESPNGFQSLWPEVADKDRLIFVVSKSIPPATYRLALTNFSENVSGSFFKDVVRVYDAQKPYVRQKSGSDENDLLIFETNNFSAIDTRFYQLQLDGDGVQYNVNGIYSDSESLLTFPVPEGMEPDSYSMQIVFSSDSGEIIYQIGLDRKLVIEN